jgi:endonuclease/exonuclease/phosphatase family metal-dependent hydrolase
MPPKLSIVSWNIARKQAAWRAMSSDRSLDVALVQEGVPPEAGLVNVCVPAVAATWQTVGGKRTFCAAVAQLSDRVTLHPVEHTGLPDAADGVLAVSRPGSLAVADVEWAGERITVVSMYAAWEPARGGKLIYADGSAHRLISDLSFLLDSQRGHKVIVAGDLNVYFGHGENGSGYWRDRYLTVFNRMAAIGLPFVGPQHPNGLQAEPWPPHLPADSKNVPTFRTRPSDAASASYQLDFVFASRDLHDRLTVTALNSVEAWGPSDHCRVRIEVR